MVEVWHFLGSDKSKVPDKENVAKVTYIHWNDPLSDQSTEV